MIYFYERQTKQQSVQKPPKNEKVKEMNDQQLISWWFLGVVENSGAGS